MNKPKHTPGPWNRLRRYEDGTLEVLNFEHKSICDLSRRDLDGVVEDAEANARLIAAAPDLLEALSEAWDYVLYYVADPNTQDKDAAEVLRKMDLAIRKATGGAE